MLLVVPYSTDTPIYHRPIGTIGLIVVNVVAFAATSEWFVYARLDDPAVAQWMLVFDQINPLQWLTNNFMHMNLFHLVGNMFFLWAYGLIVEGKIGWWRFLLIYLGIGVAEGALVQTGMYFFGGAEGGALGASGAIFGLLGIACLWAPESAMECFFIYIIWVREFAVTVWAFSFVAIAFQVMVAILSGLAMSSEVLHLTGLAIGIPIGLIALRRGWAECDGQDALTVWGINAAVSKVWGKPNRATENVRHEPQRRPATADRERQQLVHAVAEAIDADNDLVAVRLFQKHAAKLGHGRALPPEHLARIVKGLLKAEDWTNSRDAMVVLLQTAASPLAMSVRVKLAVLMCVIENRPRQALAILAKLPVALPAKLQQQADQVRQRAQRLLQDGELEVDVQDW